jgi:hypothetical protein
VTKLTTQQIASIRGYLLYVARQLDVAEKLVDARATQIRAHRQTVTRLINRADHLLGETPAAEKAPEVATERESRSTTKRPPRGPKPG